MILICLYVVEKKDRRRKGRKEGGEIIFLYRELYLLIISNQSFKTRISAFITNKAVKVISQT